MSLVGLAVVLTQARDPDIKVGRLMERFAGVRSDTARQTSLLAH